MDKKLLFLHIPKTAGTTLVRLIQKNYPNHACRGLYDQDSFEEDFSTAIADESVKAIYGHFFYPEIVDRHINQLYLFTFLRNPVKREVSNYLHLKYSSVKEHQEWAAQWASFGDYLKSKQALNHQTRVLSGIGPFEEFRANLPQAFQQAQANLNKMGLIGISEKFATSVKLISRELNWAYLVTSKENVNKHRLEARYLRLRYRREIEAVTQYDKKLYQQALNQLKG